MSGQTINTDYVSLRGVFRGLGKIRISLIGALILGLIAGAALAYMLPDQYRSEITLAPAEDSQGSALNVPSQVGNWASLAGIAMPRSGVDQVQVALEILQSRKFLMSFIERHDIKPEVMAVTGWDRESGNLVYNQTYDPESRSWILEEGRGEPSLLRASGRFASFLEIEDGARSGIIRIALDYYAPDLAESWLNSLVTELNEEMRSRDVHEAEANLRFLEERVNITSLTSIQQAVYQLMEREIQRSMLASVRREYAFQILDPAVVPESRFSPNRPLVIALTIFSMLLLAVAVHFTAFLYRASDS